MTELTQKERITQIHTDVSWMKKELEGNGKKGLIQQVRDNTNKIYYFTGGLAVIVAAIGYIAF